MSALIEAHHIRPMLAARLDNLKTLSHSFPLYGSVKIDGIRALISDGVAYSRKGLKHRNKHLQNLCLQYASVLEGCDLEITVGRGAAPDVCRLTTSGVNSYEGTPAFKFHIFDKWYLPDTPYILRLQNLHSLKPFLPPFARIVHQEILRGVQEIIDFEEEVLEKGYEGIILRSINGLYKYGRSTLNQEYLLKYKRFVDSEAVIIDYTESVENTNEAKLDELGYTKRATNAENMVPKGTLGALMVRGLEAPFIDVEFSIGIFKGYTKEDLQEMWDNRDNLIGKIAKFKYFPQGIKDKPRFPAFLTFRDEEDI